ncbi:MAG: DUF4038 domain-containing protein [Lewinellaceae bacterium]|nr:DUF4038 domain-containing protein [Lewinellaceae bacterium]
MTKRGTYTSVIANVPVCLIIFLLLISIPLAAQFPLRLSPNHRYLVDSGQQPFLIKEFSAWGLIQALSEADESAFLDSIKLRGFNTVLVSVISNATSQMGGNPPYWQGISPFQIECDFSTPNETYFQHVDRFLAMTREKGFLVLLVPCYLGYFTDGSQGWWDEVRSANNSPDKMRTYGEFLGRRYRESSNIVWVAGGDNDAKDQDEPYMQALISGIRSADDQHLWTGHFDNTSGTFWSTDNPRYRSIMELDGLYVWKEISLGDRGPHYRAELEQYGKGKMIFQLDMSYEHDVPHYADNEDPRWMRRKMYDGLLSGCAGTSFSSGTLDNQCYWFKNWKPLMNTPGMELANNCFKLFDALPWQNLIPDTSDQVLLNGRGTFGQLDFACSAKTIDGSYYVVYIPSGRTMYFNLSAISGKTFRMHWYNPRTGVFMFIGRVGKDPHFGVVTPDTDDWLLVFDANPDWQIPD